jgi:hypothetical protein
VPAALANLTRVVSAARQQGTADREAEDLLHQADDLATPFRSATRMTSARMHRRNWWS